MMATALVFGTIVSTVSSFFEGQSIAILPFEPQWFLKSMAHRGLVNPNPTDCSFIFLVCTVCLFHATVFFIYFKVYLVDHGAATTNPKAAGLCAVSIGIQTIGYGVSATERSKANVRHWQLLNTPYHQLLQHTTKSMSLIILLILDLIF